LATIACKATRCPYCNLETLFCERGAIVIDENGMCRMLWRHGVERPIRDNEVHVKEPVLIIDANVKTE
jgi:hypothetical protein